MAKITRLFRIEALNGEGLYQRTEDLGYRLNVRETRDIDLYTRGQRLEIDYVTRGGETRKYKHSPICIDYDMDYLYPNPTQVQLRLDIDTGPVPTDKSMWGTILDRMAANKYMGEIDHPPVDLFGISMQAYRREYRDMFLYEQLALDVTQPVKVVGHEISRGMSFSVASLLELQNRGTTDGYFAGDPNGNRPGAGEDGIDTDGVFGEYLFAFRSIKGLNAWLDGLGADAVLRAGARIRVIDVKNARLGKCQAVFKESEIVKEFTVTNSGLLELYRAHKSKESESLYED